jgi:hypothetical protein
MTTTITYPGGPAMVPTMPLAASGMLRARTRNVTHTILDGDPVHTLRRAEPATGTLRLLFDSETAALDCFTAHMLPAVFTVVDDDSALLNFDYIATDSPEIQIDEESLELWTVTVPVQVIP